MPIESCTLPSGSGFRWGASGHCYPTRAGAEAQAAAAHAAGYAGDSGPRSAAGILLRDAAGQALFLKRSDKGDHAGEWCLPAGGVEPGEDGATAALRELREETGYSADVALSQIARSVTDGLDFTTFAGDVDKFTPKLNDEHTEAMWAPVNEAPQPLHPGVAALFTALNGAEDAEFSESDHPRGAGGQFGAGEHTAAASTHKAKSEEHAAKGAERGEDPAKPPKGSHSEAASQHKSAAFYHTKAAEALDPDYVKKAHRASSTANNASKKVEKAEQSGTYTDKKKNDFDPTDGLTPQERQAKRIGAYLKQKHIGPRGRGDANDWATVAAQLGITPRLAADLAFDRASVRSIDSNGRMRVEVANISKANVCPYYGAEIAGFEELGLDPKKRYMLLRDPEALEAGADSFNGIPVLDDHVPSTAWDHPAGLVVGTTGSDAAFNAPYLQNSLVIWTQEAIDDIEARDKQELSCAYSYRPIMEPGNYEGVPYDGRMVDILGNHVALVATGRAGPDVLVGDSSIGTKETGMTKKALSRMALLARGALMAALKPVLATDAKLDLNVVLKDVTKKNWAASKPKIAAAIKPCLAADAALEDVVALLDTLEKAEGVEDEVPPVDTAPVVDADPLKTIMDMFKAKGATDEEMTSMGAALKNLAPRGADADLDEEEAKRKAAADAEVDKDKDKVGKPAMDAAIALARRETEASTVKRLNAIAEAREAVRPYVGTLALSFDSAEGVFRAALTQLGVKHEAVKDVAALGLILEAQRKPGEQRKTVLAADAANAASDFLKLCPGAADITVLG